MPKGYPLFLNLHGRPVLIVGGGNVALRKATGLAAAGARLTVVSPDILPDFTPLPNLTHLKSPYASAIVRQQPWRLIFAATNIPAVNEQVARDAAAANILCCRCDEPDTGDCWGGATVDRDPITIAIATGGASPVLAGKVRDACAAAIAPHWPQWAELLAAWRDTILREVSDPAARRDLLKRVAGDEIEAHLKSGDLAAAQALVGRWLLAARNPSTKGPAGE